MSAFLTKLANLGKIIWLLLGAFILLWIGYLIYKLYTISSPGLVLLVAFLLMMGLALAGIYILITITGKIISFGIKRKKQK
ncbi:MAG TPA: hypothetical protein VJI15_01310 [Candidatus Nanoarchaeia archaeon]|nr:hypothetical protein [Candidatus Nanoarchaeia archaeon]